MPKQQFQTLFCERFGCSDSRYEDQMFRRCLYWHARLIAPVLRKVFPDFFAEDLKFIGYLGTSTGLDEIRLDILNFRDANLSRRSFLRSSLRIRASGRRAGRLAQQLFAEAGDSREPD